MKASTVILKKRKCGFVLFSNNFKKTTGNSKIHSTPLQCNNEQSERRSPVPQNWHSYGTLTRCGVISIKQIATS